MEDELEEDESDFEVIKRKKTSSFFSNNFQTHYRRNVKPKRSLPLSLKSARSKKKACGSNNIKAFFEKQNRTLDGSSDGTDQLKFCPVCQVPFPILVGLSVEDHVQDCVTKYAEPSDVCQNGVNCTSIVPHHFKKYSHKQLASVRSLQIPEKLTSHEKVQHNDLTDVESTLEAHLKSSKHNLTNGSEDTANTSSSADFQANSSTTFCANNFSLNTVNHAESVEQTLQMFEHELDSESPVGPDTQSSEKENLDDVNCWLNDGLEYEDFECSEIESNPTQTGHTNFCKVWKPARCVTNETVETVLDTAVLSTEATSNATIISETTSTVMMLNSKTTVVTVSDLENSRTITTPKVVTTAHSAEITSCTENVTSFNMNSQHDNSESSEEQFVCKSPRTQKQLSKTTAKQMDIGVYFGLKPKHKVTPVKTESVSKNVLQQKDVVEKQTNTQCRDRSKVPQTKKCPFYKIVEGTSFAVDAFSYGHIPGISSYFLSHFHYDHYGGLKRSFSKPIYCSQITANLVSLKIKVAARFIRPLSLHTPTVIENIEVTLLEANHCPGAVMFIFKLPTGQTHLHTGDFRASTSMQEIPFLNRPSIHTIYLDTTYCDPSYSFPPQRETVEFCVSVATQAVARNTRTLIVVGTYTIGKEKIFVAVANALQCKVAVQRDKYNVLQCLESEKLKNIITQKYEEASVHVLPMAQLVHKKLAEHLQAYSSQYSKLLAFKPTGWTYTDSYEHDLKKIKPSKRASVTIYGVPYSEHSSFNELKEFVQFIKPHKIIPTVNNGSAKRRDEMKNIFKTWLRN